MAPLLRAPSIGAIEVPMAGFTAAGVAVPSCSAIFSGVGAVARWGRGNSFRRELGIYEVNIICSG